jgi:hypothetical protein
LDEEEVVAMGAAVGGTDVGVDVGGAGVEVAVAVAGTGVDVGEPELG